MNWSNYWKGTISVKSTLDKGTEFEVTLPIRHESEIKTIQENGVLMPQKHVEDFVVLDVIPSSINEPNQISEKPLVLITDDNADVRAYIASCLTTDYRLNIAKDGQECEDIAFDTTPDLIVLDVMMPFKNGFDVCKTLKQDERTSHIPIILLTAKADMDSKLNGLERGADAYLMKPFHKEELLLRIKKLLELRLQLQHYYRSTISDVGFRMSDELTSDIPNPKYGGTTSRFLRDTEGGTMIQKRYLWKEISLLLTLLITLLS